MGKQLVLPTVAKKATLVAKKATTSNVTLTALYCHECNCYREISDLRAMAQCYAMYNLEEMIQSTTIEEMTFALSSITEEMVVNRIDIICSHCHNIIIRTNPDNVTYV